MTRAPGIVLFHRDFRFFSGGHLNVWRYFCHTTHHQHLAPRMQLTTSSMVEGNPWAGVPELVVAAGSIETPAVRFLAGLDWQRLPETVRRCPDAPVVNLVQHVRHAEPTDPRYRYLEHPAVRLCLSRPVEEALRRTGRVNGPIMTIPNGLDITELPPVVARDERTIDVLICGIKQPGLAERVGGQLGRRHRIVALTDRVPRYEYLSLVSRARVALLLPNPTEGFYIPALEAMALETVVVVPDCVGNRDFCHHGRSSIVPSSYTEAALLRGARDALALRAGERDRLLDQAAAVAARHDGRHERATYLGVLDAVLAGTDPAAAGLDR